MTAPERPAPGPKAPSKRRSRRLLFSLGVVALAAVVLSTGSTVSQFNDPTDQRNKQCGERAGCNASQDCWMHHRGEGMTDAFILVPIFPAQMKVGQESVVPVQIINPWKNHLGGLSMKVNMRTAEEEEAIAFVPGASAGSTSGPTDQRFTFEGRFEHAPGSTTSGQAPIENLEFPVERGATAIVATMNLQFRPSPGVDPTGGYFDTGVESKLWGPTSRFGVDFEPRNQERATARNLTVLYEDVNGPLRNQPPGNWSVRLEWDSSQFSGQYVDYNVIVEVLYTSAGGAAKSYEIPIDPSVRVAPGSSTVVNFPLNGFKAGTQKVEIEVRGYTNYEKGHQDGITPDWDNYTRYAVVDVPFGDSFVPSSAGLVEVSGPGEDVRLVMAEITGFASAVLLLPSILLGGTFGRGSRKLFNTMLGGAKRRVMFHSLASLGITLTAVVHIIMFMLEIRYTIMMGMLWGGLGALSLLVLGLTGYYQVPMIQRHGYKFWRYTHLAFGILVLVFVSWHAIVDGPDFNFFREQLPDWLTKINLSQK